MRLVIKALVIGLLIACFSQAQAADGKRFLPVWDFGKDTSIPGIELPVLDAAARSRLSSQPRYALVIGNGSGYQVASMRVDKVDRSAKSMALMLRHLGFTVFGKLNATAEEMRRMVDGFAEEVAAAKDPLLAFYFGGHGVQVEGTNYLMPVEFPATADPITVAHYAFKLNYAVSRLQGIKATRLILLENCRTEPMVLGLGAGDGDGYARMPTSTGTLVAYATQPRTLAWIGGEQLPHTVFTEHLLRELAKPRRRLSDLLDDVKREVYGTTAHHQLPEISNSIIGEVYVVPPSCTPETDQAEWNNALGALSAETLREYRRRCPDGRYLHTSAVLMGKFLSAQSEQPSQKPLTQGLNAPGQKLASTPQEPATAPSIAGGELRKSRGINPDTGDGVAERQNYLAEKDRTLPPSVVPHGVIMISGQWLEPGSVFKDCTTCPEMVVVPSGRLLINDGQKKDVVIPNQFAVGKYEVTQADWYSRFGEFSTPHVRGTKHPITDVSHDDIDKYIDSLNGTLSRNGDGGVNPYRLLTEEEWEYAARGGITKNVQFNMFTICNHANGADMDSNLFGPAKAQCRDGYSETAPVGTFKPNAFGLYDMLGNVWEIVDSCRKSRTDSRGVVVYEIQAIEPCDRVIRGGSWASAWNSIHYNFGGLASHPDLRRIDVGFRLARTLP